MTVSVVRFLLRSGPQMLLCASVVCISIGALWPGQSLSDRLFVIAYAAASISIVYGFFRIVLGAFARFGERAFGRLMFWYIAFALYGGLVASPLAIVSLPFQWQLLYTEGMTAPMFLASIPAGLSMSLAAAHVIDKHYVEV